MNKYLSSFWFGRRSMKVRRHYGLVLVCAAVVGATVNRPCLAEGDSALIGCWRGEKVVNYEASGKFHVASQKNTVCTLSFSMDRFVSLCVRPGEETRTEYSYSVPRAGVYIATMIANRYGPISTLGSTRESEYAVKDNRLSITTYPQTTKPNPLTQVVKVESISVRLSTLPCDLFMPRTSY